MPYRSYDYLYFICRNLFFSPTNGKLSKHILKVF